MWRYFTFKNTYRYVDVLENLVETYNNTPHSTIKMAPEDVSDKMFYKYGKIYTRRIWQRKSQNSNSGILVEFQNKEKLLKKGTNPSGVKKFSRL